MTENENTPDPPGLDEVRRELGRVVKPGAVGPWLSNPNPAFGGARPLDLILAGEAGRVLAMVREMEAGTAE